MLKSLYKSMIQRQGSLYNGKKTNGEFVLSGVTHGEENRKYAQISKPLEYAGLLVMEKDEDEDRT